MCTLCGTEKCYYPILHSLHSVKKQRITESGEGGGGDLIEKIKERITRRAEEIRDRKNKERR